jgi:hypothetical protein
MRTTVSWNSASIRCKTISRRPSVVWHTSATDPRRASALLRIPQPHRAAHQRDGRSALGACRFDPATATRSRTGLPGKAQSRTGKRDLPLSPAMTDRLLTHRARTYEGEKASAFPSEGKLRKTKDGFAFPFDSKALARDVLIPTRGVLGLDWVTFHTFRHTCTSLLFAEGRTSGRFPTGSGMQTPPSRCAPTSICLIQGSVTPTFLTPRSRPRARPGQRGVRECPQVGRPSKPRIWQPRAKMSTSRKQP